jgi:pterin-4a-carbinolamine dehydratase
MMNRNEKSEQSVQAKRKRLPPPEWELAVQRLKSERVQEELKAMPGWKLLPGGSALGRAWDLPDTGVALAYAAYVTRYAEAWRLRASATVHGGQVLLSLRAKQSRDVTRGVIELAKRLG